MGIQYIYIEYGQLELVSVVNSTREPGEPFSFSGDIISERSGCRLFIIIFVIV